MTTVNVREAKTHLSRILDRVAAGEEVVIARAGKPVARLVPIAVEHKIRTPDTYRGRIRIADDFDAPLPDDVRGPLEGRYPTAFDFGLALRKDSPRLDDINKLLAASWAANYGQRKIEDYLASKR